MPKQAMPLPPMRIEIRDEKPEKPEKPEQKVLMYGYVQAGLAGHFSVYKIELPVGDPRLIKVADKQPKRAAFEKVLYLVREQLFRAALTYKRPPQNTEQA